MRVHGETKGVKPGQDARWLRRPAACGSGSSGRVRPAPRRTGSCRAAGRPRPRRHCPRRPRQHLGQAEGAEGGSTTARAASVAYPLAPRAGSQAVEDLKAELLERPQPDRADEFGPAFLLDEPDAVPVPAECRTLSSMVWVTSAADSASPSNRNRRTSGGVQWASSTAWSCGVTGRRTSRFVVRRWSTPARLPSLLRPRPRRAAENRPGLRMGSRATIALRRGSTMGHFIYQFGGKAMVVGVRRHMPRRRGGHTTTVTIGPFNPSTSPLTGVTTGASARFSFTGADTAPAPPGW